jgi:hypothetical protein
MNIPKGFTTARVLDEAAAQIRGSMHAGMNALDLAALDEASIEVTRAADRMRGRKEHMHIVAYALCFAAGYVACILAGAAR